MSEPKTFMQEVYKELALAFRQNYEQNLKEIETFEGIFKDKKLSKETRDLVKDILNVLYSERDKNGNKAEQYRKIYNAVEGCPAVITWCKS